MTETPKTIQAALTDRLIAKIPSFFGGRLAALRELFQNSHRAGARSVTIRHEGNLLVFEDDGIGCPDPQLLLSAGETGWDETKITEPAGMGFYSVLHESVAASVEVHSQNWRVHLVATDVLQRRPILVEHAEPRKGMCITLLLVDPKADQDLREARGYYPFHVTLNGETLPPAEVPDAKREFDTPVGRVVECHKRWPDAPDPCFPIWEYRAIEGDQNAFQRAMIAAAAQNPVRRGLLADFVYAWFVDPKSGTRPKLPDRNDLDVNPALHAAAETILRAAEDHHRALAQQATASWPRVLTDEPEASETRWIFDTNRGRALRREFGWRAATCEDYEDLGMYYVENGGWQDNLQKIHRYTKDYILVQDTNDAAVAQSINYAIHLGANLPFAVRARGAPDTPELASAAHVEITGLQAAEEGWISLAKEIRIAGHTLPFLLCKEGRLVIATDIDTLVRLLTGQTVELPGLPAQQLNQWIQNYVARGDEGDWLANSWWDYDEEDLHREALRADLITRATMDFLGPKIVKAREHYYALVAKRQELADVVETITRLHQAKLLARRAPIHALESASRRALEDLDASLARAAKRAKVPQ